MPGVPEENYWLRRHEAAYRHLLPMVAGVRVLEVGCGEGYGTALLAESAASVVGVDYDAATVAHAADTYARAAFVRANLAALPVRDASRDLVVSLQVIEHVWDHAEFLAECRRILRPGGGLVLTTPNRLTFSPGSDRPVNPFHTHEFTAAELRELVAGCGFARPELSGIHAGARLTALDAVHGGSLVSAQLATAPAGWSAELWADVGSVTVADFEVLGEAGREVDDALDLLVVARRTD